MEMTQIQATHVPEFDILEVPPDPLVRVEIRRIAGQLLKMNLFRCAIGQAGFDFLTPMNRRAVPNHQQLAARLPEQMLQKMDTINTRQRIITNHREQGALRSNPAHHRQMIAGLKDTEDRGVTTRRIRPDRSRQQVAARFVHKDEGSALQPRFFFISFQTAVRQWAIAPSSRWVARSMGSCGVQFTSFSRRATWDLWDDTPNSHSSTFLTRGQVQMSPRNPYASAPCDNSSGISHFSSGVSSGGRPVCGRAKSAALPLTKLAAIHWLTAPFVTPKAPAISFCFQP